MQGKNVLVVDDSELVLTMARDFLEKAGFVVSTAESGIEANRYIYAPVKPDLIILDVMLPMLDGNKKARMLKDKEETKHIPILLLSSKEETELQRLVGESGANGYIRKPFTPELIVSMVKRHLEAS